MANNCKFQCIGPRSSPQHPSQTNVEPPLVIAQSSCALSTIALNLAAAVIVSQPAHLAGTCGKLTYLSPSNPLISLQLSSFSS